MIISKQDFLTDDLVTQDDANDSHKKYLGVCQLPNENSLVRALEWKSMLKKSFDLSFDFSIDVWI
jgi:hypothetical protein